MTGKLLIKNVWLADGTGSPLRKGACLTAHDGTVAAVEKEFSGCCAEEVFDGRGAILSPGFIDAHGHSDISALSAPECFINHLCWKTQSRAFPPPTSNRKGNRADNLPTGKGRLFFVGLWPTK